MSNQVVIYDVENTSWLWFSEPLDIIVAQETEEVLQKLERIESKVMAEGLYAAGFLAYEAASAFDPVLQTLEPTAPFPLLWMGLYRQPLVCEQLPLLKVGNYELGEWQPNLKEAEYRQVIRQIKHYIARGDTYQVNYTFRLQAPFQGSAWSLFNDLQRAQQAPYGAYIETDEFAVCSASPELFFKLDGNHLFSRPMKGTAPRGYNLEDDNAQMRWLHGSEKNRAENVMIVDMVRNDMGRIAHFGSVTVPKLFDVERYPTVLQMTSTVQAVSEASVSQILAALFPCASITGAPKVRTMQILAQLETSPRGIYTGALGFMAPPGEQSRRRAQFSVPIRTVQIDKIHAQAEYGVGSGIIWDSNAVSEYQECRVKARVLTDPLPTFSILESLLWEPDKGYFLLDRHIERLRDGATYFVIPLDLEAVQAALQDLADDLSPLPHKVRLLVAQDGAITTEAAPIVTGSSEHPLRVKLAASPISSTDPFLYFKTTHRIAYEEALAGRPDCDDVLLWNERNELTESSRANIVFRMKGELFTPPIYCGLLAGTFRAELLAKGIIREQVVRLEDLKDVEEIYLINSVRRWLKTDWEDDELVPMTGSSTATDPKPVQNL